MAITCSTTPLALENLSSQASCAMFLIKNTLFSSCLFESETLACLQC